MDDGVRAVAWAIAETWWRKNHRQAAGAVPEATTSAEYADNFWQGFCEEAKAAIAVMAHRASGVDGPARPAPFAIPIDGPALSPS